MFVVYTRRNRAERGDTIVEVLIAIAVMSLILGGAFVVTNRSLQGTRSAQERLNGAKLVESQMEQIKSIAATDSSKLFGASALPSFCVVNGTDVVSSSDSRCAVGADGSPAGAGESPIFHLSARREGNTFRVQNTWDNARGSGKDSIEMTYRLYE